MNLVQILDRIGREINQKVFDNSSTVTRDDMITAIQDCNNEMSDLNLSFNEAAPADGTWDAGDNSISIATPTTGMGISTFDRIRRLELDGVKAHPLANWDQLDRLRGSFDTSQDVSFNPYPPVYMIDGGKVWRWPYSEAVAWKMWYYKELAALDTQAVGVDAELYTSGNTYSVPTVLTEGATHVQTYTPRYANQAGILIDVVADGGEPLTVTVHNSLHVQQGQKTIYNVGTGRTMFPIAWTWAAGTYHFHVHKNGTVGTTTIRTTTASDLETCMFEAWYANTPEIPTRYHNLYVFYAVAAALRKLGDTARAETYDDGKEVEQRGQSKYRQMKYNMKFKMANKTAADRNKHIQNNLEDEDQDY